MLQDTYQDRDDSCENGAQHVLTGLMLDMLETRSVSKTALEGVTTYVVPADRDIVEELLALNVDNPRPLRSYDVSRYVSLMEKGEWRYSRGAPINITGDRGMTNGQHRLTARLKAGYFTGYLEIRYTERDEGDSVHLDSGATRSTNNRSNLALKAAGSGLIADHIKTYKTSISNGQTPRDPNKTELDWVSEAEAHAEAICRIWEVDKNLPGRRAQWTRAAFLHCYMACKTEAQRKACVAYYQAYVETDASRQPAELINYAIKAREAIWMSVGRLNPRPGFRLWVAYYNRFCHQGGYKRRVTDNVIRVHQEALVPSAAAIKTAGVK